MRRDADHAEPDLVERLRDAFGWVGRYLQPPAVAPLSELESAWLAWIAEPSSPPPSTVLTPASPLFPKWLRAMLAPQRAAAAREDATFNRRYGRL